MICLAIRRALIPCIRLVSFLVMLSCVSLTGCGSSGDDGTPDPAAPADVGTAGGVGSAPPAGTDNPGQAAARQALVLIADREQTMVGGPNVTLTVSGVNEPGQTAWTVAPGSRGALSSTSGASVQYIPPATDAALNGSIIPVVATNGSMSARINIALLPITGATEGTTDANPNTPPPPGDSNAFATSGIFLLAGNDFGAGIADGTGTAARFDTPTGVARDAQGNLYVADRFNNAIRKISEGGVVSTLAGLPGAQGHADGAGTTARFVTPWGVAVDAAGNLYVADQGDQAIRKISPDGGVTTVAGNAESGNAPSETDAARRFSGPTGIAVDAGGTLYVSDVNVVRRITPEGTVSILAGQPGIVGSQDGSAGSATFTSLQGIAVDIAGNVYVVDGGLIPGPIPSNSVNVAASIRRISASGTVSTLAGAGGTALDAVLGFADGNGATARFSFPEGLAIDGAGNLIVGDRGNHAVRRVAPNGTVTTLAGMNAQQGSNDGETAEARFGMVSGVAVGSDGAIYVADATNHTVRRITPDGQVATLAGAAPRTGSADGARTQATFAVPLGLTRDPSGALYVADSGNQTIRRIGTDGEVTTFAGAAGLTGGTNGASALARFNLPRDVAADGAGNIFVSDFLNRLVRRITPAGIVSTYAGVLESSGHQDGPAASARFVEPQAVAVDQLGNVLVADRADETIRKITPEGIVSTLAGQPGSSGSNLFLPQDIAVDKAGNVYVIDSGSLVRKITPDGVVSNLAGVGFQHGIADGTGSAARFNFPQSLTVDDDGNVYVADSRAIRKVTQQGVVTTVAGAALAPQDARLHNIHRPAGLVMTGPKALAFTAGEGVFELRLP
jgi:sugar lactone lactonase YvrE